MELSMNHRMLIAKRCIIKVGDDNNFPNYWAKSIVGLARQVVEIFQNGNTTYIDNEDGTGWIKVTENPNGCYREIKADKVIGYLK